MSVWGHSLFIWCGEESRRQTSLEIPYCRKGAATGGGPQDSSEVACRVVALPTTTAQHTKGKRKEGASLLEWTACTSRTTVSCREGIQVPLEAVALSVSGKSLRNRQGLGSARQSQRTRG